MEKHKVLIDSDRFQELLDREEELNALQTEEILLVRSTKNLHYHSSMPSSILTEQLVEHKVMAISRDNITHYLSKEQPLLSKIGELEREKAKLEAKFGGIIYNCLSSVNLIKLNISEKVLYVKLSRQGLEMFKDLENKLEHAKTSIKDGNP